MSTTTVNLGYVPKNRGEYSSTASYYKDNIVQYNGSSYICNPPNYDPDTAPTASVIGVAPYDSDPAVPNTGWAVFCNDSSGVGEGVYNVSVDHTTDNNPKIYVSLSAALQDIPQAKKKGGMEIRFILNNSDYAVDKEEGITTQPAGTLITSSPTMVDGTYKASQLVTYFSTLPTATGAGNAVIYYKEVDGTYTTWTITLQSSDNKYVQYRLMSDTFSANIGDWQEYDLESLNDVVLGKPYTYEYEILQDSFKIPILKEGNIIEIKIKESTTNPPNIFFVTQIGTSKIQILGNISDLLPHKFVISSNADKLYFYNNKGAESIKFEVRQIGLNELYDTVGVLNVTLFNNGAQYSSLSSAISAIPTPLQKGGMTIKYIDASTGKYLQYRLLSASWSSSENDWQGVDNAPVENSKNLITSGAVYPIEKMAIDSRNQIGYTYEFTKEALQESFVLPVFKKGNYIEITILESENSPVNVLFTSQIGTSTIEELGHIKDVGVSHLYEITEDADKLYYYQGTDGLLKFTVHQLSINDSIKKSAIFRLGISEKANLNNVVSAFENQNNSPISIDLLSKTKALVKIDEKSEELQVSDFELGTGVSVQNNKIVFNDVSYLIGAGYVGELIRGRKYKVSFTIRNLIKGKVTVYNGSTAVVDKAFVVPGTFDVTFVAVHENLHIVSGVSNSSFDLQEVSITELSLYEYDNINTILEKTPTSSNPSYTNGDDYVIFNGTPEWYGISKGGIMTVGKRYMLVFEISDYEAGKIGLRNDDAWEIEANKNGQYSVIFTSATQNLSLLSSDGNASLTIKNVRLYELSEVIWQKNEDELLLSNFDNIFVGYSVQEPYYIKKMVITDKKPSTEDREYINSAIGAKALLDDKFNYFGVLNNNIIL